MRRHDPIANQCVYTFKACLGNHTQLVLQGSDNHSAPQSSLTLLERSFLSSGNAIFGSNGNYKDQLKFGNKQTVTKF